MTKKQEQKVVDNVKEMIEPLFDTDSGRKLLDELQQYIETNLNELPL